MNNLAAYQTDNSRTYAARLLPCVFDVVQPVSLAEDLLPKKLIHARTE